MELVNTRRLTIAKIARDFFYGIIRYASFIN